MRPLVFDEGDGIRLELDLETGMSVNLYMDDETAQNLVNIIQNKLDGRF